MTSLQKDVSYHFTWKVSHPQLTLYNKKLGFTKKGGVGFTKKGGGIIPPPQMIKEYMCSERIWEVGKKKADNQTLLKTSTDRSKTMESWW